MLSLMALRLQRRREDSWQLLLVVPKVLSLSTSEATAAGDWGGVTAGLLPLMLMLMRLKVQVPLQVELMGKVPPAPEQPAAPAAAGQKQVQRVC
jgi:hypothetical protein